MHTRTARDAPKIALSSFPSSRLSLSSFPSSFFYPSSLVPVPGGGAGPNQLLLAILSPEVGSELEETQPQLLLAFSAREVGPELEDVCSCMIEWK